MYQFVTDTRTLRNSGTGQISQIVFRPESLPSWKRLPLWTIFNIQYRIKTMAEHCITQHETGNNIGNGVEMVRSRTSRYVNIWRSTTWYLCGTVSHSEMLYLQIRPSFGLQRHQNNILGILGNSNRINFKLK